MARYAVDWSRIDETILQRCIEDAYTTLGFECVNHHNSSRNQEDGVDITCTRDDETILIAVKIKPKKADEAQLGKFASHKASKRVYVYGTNPTKNFADHIHQYKERIEFLTGENLADFLIENSSIYLSLLLDQTMQENPLRQ